MVALHLYHEAWYLMKNGRHVMFSLGTACAMLFGGILAVQSLAPMPLWAIFVLYAAFLLPHTMMLVALIRGMLMELMREKLTATLRWRAYHTNFLYDSLFFLGVGALVLFSADAAIILLNEYATAVAELEARGAQAEIPYGQGIRDAFGQLRRTGILTAMGVTGALFFALMVVWARNIIQMPAAALGYRIRKEEARLMMHGHVLLVATTTFLCNGMIALLAVALTKLLARWMPVQYYTPLAVGLTYWATVYVNVSFWCSAFRLFTEEYSLRSDFKGY